MISGVKKLALVPWTEQGHPRKEELGWDATLLDKVYFSPLDSREFTALVKWQLGCCHWASRRPFSGRQGEQVVIAVLHAVGFSGYRWAMQGPLVGIRVVWAQGLWQLMWARNLRSQLC